MEKLRMGNKKNNKDSASFEENVLLFIKTSFRTLLTDLGYKVVDFSFDKIVMDPSFRRLIRKSYANTDVGMILTEAPELFVMHKKKDPEEGVFFIKLYPMARGDEKNFIKIPARHILSRYFPSEKILMIVITGNGPAHLYATWLGTNSELDISRMKQFATFIKDDLKVEPNLRLHEKLNKELAKMYSP